MRVRDIMSKPVVALGPDEPIERASHLARAHGLRHLPVTIGPKLVGVVEAADLESPILRRQVLEEIGGADLRVRDVMRVHPPTLPADATLGEATHLLHVRRAAVLFVLEGSHLVGIVAESDLVDLFAQTASRLRDVIRRYRSQGGWIE